MSLPTKSPSIMLPVLFSAFFMASAVPPAFAQHTCRESKHGRQGHALKGGGALALWPMDILHQRIHLDLTQPNGIVASCEIIAKPRQEGLDHFPLDLLGLTVDSVTTPSGPLAFNHEGELLEITLNASPGLQDTISLTVHYQGYPATDQSGFGGFYLTSYYLYNLGVAFNSIPHSYGRAWFPCADNFTERNSYEFIVRTHAGRNAWCNGELVEETWPGGDTLVRHWRINETIPAYLASVAASNYTVVRDTLESISGSAVPVTLVAQPADTTNLKNSFVNLPLAFEAFEYWFGHYRWNKVGYVVTPLGAMEHSTSIHYPRSIVNGNLQYEDIMAHELAHQWWGNQVTCERAEEMYLNEGFAEYLSFLFLEWVYGPERYANVVRANHRKMVHRAHLLDQGWWALAEVPQAWTYGEHSYNKGADVIHSLRGYLGDVAFREGLTSFLSLHAFEAVNSTLLRDHLTAATGMDLTPFFNDFIFQPGWAAFEVDSFHVTSIGEENQITVHVQQKLRGADVHYTNVPVSVTLMDAQGVTWTAAERPLLSGEWDSFTLTAPFAPSVVLLNADERISLAVTRDVDTLDAIGIRNYSNADLRITVNSIQEPIHIQLEEYWVAADPGTTEDFAFMVSPDRWWRILGNIPEDASLSGRITFDGRPTNSGSLDLNLMQDQGGVAFHEDSLVLLYRPDQHQRWSPYPDHVVYPLNNPTDKFGRVEWDDLRAGEYTLGWRTSAVGISSFDHSSWTVQPNPAQDHVIVGSANELRPGGTLQLFDANGRLVKSTPWSGGQQRIALHGLAQGTYQLHYTSQGGQRMVVDRIVLTR